jgi:hypothetical protein
MNHQSQVLPLGAQPLASGILGEGRKGKPFRTSMRQAAKSQVRKLNRFPHEHGAKSQVKN